jgi:hypothetical protein
MSNLYFYSKGNTYPALEANCLSIVSSLPVSKLDAQDAGLRARGRALSDGGVRARFYHAVAEAHLRRIIRVDLQSELFTYDIDPNALALARAMDGKLLLVTNVKDLSADEVVAQYKALADIASNAASRS